MTTFSSTRVQLLAIALILGISGCSSFEQTSLSVSERGMPSFTGPYANEMAEAYRNSESPFFKEAISDASITEAEFREGNEREAQCLRDKGFTNVVFHADGSSEYDVRADISGEQEKALVKECSVTTGNLDVSVWYDLLRTNPDNVDWPTAERDCLVKSGLLEPGTSVEEMNRWYDEKGKGSDSRAAYVCSEDALGKLGLK